MMRPSNPALLAVSATIRQHRDALIAEWARWVSNRLAQAPHIRRPTVDRYLQLMVDIVIQLAGPLRRQATELWFQACEAYGVAAAARGLAAGEVVEEIQQLRELLIRHLSETVSLLPPRQSIAAVLRLNRVLDRGLAHTVVGYTDALVETLLNRRGVPIVASEPAEDEIIQRLTQLEEELARLEERTAENAGR
jgi:hypothetical protein